MSKKDREKAAASLDELIKILNASISDPDLKYKRASPPLYTYAFANKYRTVCIHSKLFGGVEYHIYDNSSYLVSYGIPTTVGLRYKIQTGEELMNFLINLNKEDEERIEKGAGCVSSIIVFVILITAFL